MAILFFHSFEVLIQLGLVYLQPLDDARCSSLIERKKLNVHLDRILSLSLLFKRFNPHLNRYYL